MSRDVLKLVLALLHLQIKTLDFKNIFSGILVGILNLSSVTRAGAGYYLGNGR